MIEKLDLDKVNVIELAKKVNELIDAANKGQQ
jgi:hypothetical protein